MTKKDSQELHKLYMDYVQLMDEIRKSKGYDWNIRTKTVEAYKTIRLMEKSCGVKLYDH